MNLLKKTKVIAIIFYVLAAIFLLYTLFTIVQVSMYLSSVESSGMYVQIGIMDKISYFVAQSGPALFYTLATFGIGYLIQLVSSGIKIEEKETSTDFDLSSDKDYDLSPDTKSDETEAIEKNENETEALADSEENLIDEVNTIDSVVDFEPKPVSEEQDDLIEEVEEEIIEEEPVEEEVEIDVIEITGDSDEE